MVLEPPSGDCEGSSRWMRVGSRESKEELAISCRDSPPVGSGSVPRETPMSAELRIVSPSPELCVPLPPGTEAASRQTRTTAGSRGGPLHSQQAHRFPVKRQVGSAGRQLRCSASPSPSRAVDRGAPSHQKSSPLTWRERRHAVHALHAVRSRPRSLHVERLYGSSSRVEGPPGRWHFQYLMTND